jgi:hypothetical protein
VRPSAISTRLGSCSASGPGAARSGVDAVASGPEGSSAASVAGMAGSLPPPPAASWTFAAICCAPVGLTVSTKRT